MILKKVSRMGDRMRVIYLPTTDFRRGQNVRLKPKSRRYYIIRKVSKMGEHLVVVIPKADWHHFRHRSVVFITEVTR
jgi:hypothetical protein